MERMLKRAGMAASVALLTVAGVLGSSLVAHADNIQDTIDEDVPGTALILEAGSSTSKSAGIHVIANSAQDPESGCNIDAGETLFLDIITPTGVTATPNPLSISSCGDDFPVAFTASSAAVSGTVTVVVSTLTNTGGGYKPQVNIPITITQPTPTNTKPTVTVQGVSTGSYEVGAVPAATCSVTDTQDGPSSFPAVVTGTLVHGLGSQTATCNHTDAGGLAADTATVSYSIVDTGAPGISHTLDPAAPNANLWYKAPVDVAFTCTDGGSGIDSCGPDTVLYEGKNQSYTGTATDWAGNSTTDTVSGINVDTTVPTVGHRVVTDATPTNGWYTKPVRIEFDCTDALSGIESCSGDTDLAEGAGQSATGTATDKAGNTASDPVTGINVDTIAPSISSSLTPGAGPNANGWYRTAVGVKYTCEDDGSGIESCGPDTELLEGLDRGHTGTATDKAGNTASDSVSGIDIDTTVPLIAAKLTPGTGANSNGWYNTDVIVDFQCTDALSGVESCTGDTTIGEGDGPATGVATDLAGNTAEASVVGIQVDTTDPIVEFAGAFGSSYVWGQVPAKPTCTASDGLSGLAADCVVDGYSIAVGSHTLKASVTDLAGNTSEVTLDYTVLAWNLSGFFSPVDMGGVWNTVKGGSTVPLKFEVFAGGTELTDIASITGFTTQAVTCATGLEDSVEFITTGATQLRYDTTAGQFVQNWATPKKPGTCVKVTMTTDDGSFIAANFKLK